MLQNMQMQRGLVLAYLNAHLKSNQVKKDLETIGLRQKLAIEEKAMKELKKKLVDSESSLKVLSQQMHQLEEEASDQYAFGYSWAHLESFHRFREGQLVLAEAEPEIAKLANFMSNAMKEEEPKHDDGESDGASGRLKEDAVESTPEVKPKSGQVDKPESDE